MLSERFDPVLLPLISTPESTGGIVKYFLVDPEANTSEIGTRSPNARSVSNYSILSSFLYGHALEI